MSASAYWKRRTGQRSARSLEDERLLEVIRVTHRRNYEAYGYRRMWKALLRSGEHAPRCQVQRLMAEHGIRGAKRRGKLWRTTKADPGALRPPDLVERDFTAEAPNRLWVGDFTHLRCWEGVLYLAFISDVFSRMIVGWQLAANMRTTLVLDALRMALGLRAPGADFQLVAHSDAGSQGGFKLVVATLDRRGVAMGRPRGWGSEQTGRAVMRSPGRPPAGRREHRVRFWEAIARGLSSVGRGRGGGGVGGRWCPVVSRGWRDAAVRDPLLAVGALPVVRRARGDRAAARPEVWGAGDRAPAGALAVDDLSRAAP